MRRPIHLGFAERIPAQIDQLAGGVHAHADIVVFAVSKQRVLFSDCVTCGAVCHA